MEFVEGTSLMDDEEDYLPEYEREWEELGDPEEGY